MEFNSKGCRPLTGEYRFIAHTDPALSHGESEEEQKEFVHLYLNYLSLGEDAASTLPVRAGMKPAIWRLRHLAGWAEAKLKEQVRREIEKGRDLDGCSFEVRYLATKLAVVNVENVVLTEGGALSLESQTDEHTGIRWLTEDAMAHIQRLENYRGACTLVEDIGGEVVRRTFSARPKS